MTKKLILIGPIAPPPIGSIQLVVTVGLVLCYWVTGLTGDHFSAYGQVRLNESQQCLNEPYNRRKHFMPRGWRHKGEDWRDRIFQRDTMRWQGEPLIEYDHRGKPIQFAIVDPYTGQLMTKRGQSDTEHLIPLKWAWDNGANCWDQETREDFAHAPSNLFAASASSNRAKGAGLLAEGMPPNIAKWNWYFVKVKQELAYWNLRPRESDERAAGYVLTIVKKHSRWVSFTRIKNWWGKEVGVTVE